MLIIFPPLSVNEMTDLLVNYALKFPVDAVLPAAAEAAGQWVENPLPLASQPANQSVSPAAATGAAHSSPSMGHWGLHLAARSRARGTRTGLFNASIYLFFLSHSYFEFVALRNFFESHFHSATFTYGSRIWAQVAVSLGETSLWCCCCCCWKVRFIISFIVWFQGHKMKLETILNVCNCTKACFQVAFLKKIGLCRQIKKQHLMKLKF